MTGIEPRRRGERLRVEQRAEELSAGTEGMTGIEPALSAWEAEVLPLNYIPALELEAKAISGLRRDASAGARLGHQVA